MVQTEGRYHVWSEVEASRTENDYTFTRSIFSDPDCLDEILSQSIELPLTCETILIEGNLDPYPNILYSGQVLDELPPVPGNGWVDKYYDHDDPWCNTVIGFTYLEVCKMEPHSCAIEYNQFNQFGLN